jgi:AbrB family looped-hinge helix DNA binding protein
MKAVNLLSNCQHELMNATPISDTIRFTSKGCVVIPAWLRKELGIDEGTRAIVYQEGDAIVVLPITTMHIRNLRGVLKGSGVLTSMTDRRKREREREYIPFRSRLGDRWAPVARRSQIRSPKFPCGLPIVRSPGAGGSLRRTLRKYPSFWELILPAPIAY